MNDWHDLGLDARYVVVGELGRGAASRVIQVQDPLQDASRALKLATRDGQVRRYQTEFRRIRELRHPNIVRAFDYGLTRSGLPYYTMELVQGASLGRFPDRREPEALGVIAMQLLDALAAIHARGWVHRDVKPRNILTVGRGTALAVRLIDFGLLIGLGESAAAAGTLPYMAPEVARSGEVDGRADLYALGMVLYEALLPGRMASTVEEVARTLVERLPSPVTVNPVISAGFSDFIMRLIDPDPAARFRDAGAAVLALGRLEDLRLGRGPARSAAERLLRGGAVSHRARFVKKVRKLAATVKDDERGQSLLIDGTTGVGKSPFLREVATLLCIDGFRVARFRTTNDAGSPIPAMLRAARAMRPDVFTPQAPVAALISSSSGPAEMARFAGQIGLTLAEAFGGVPTAIVVDDLHRAEPVALDVLRALMDELDAVPIVLIGGADPRPDGTPAADLLGASARVLTLQPLRAGEVAELASHRLFGLTLPAPALSRLVQDSQGMPSLVEKTLARLIVDGTIQRDGSRFQFTGGRYRAANHADQDQISARVSQVREEDRPVLNAAAVLGHHLDAGAIGRMLDLDLGCAAGTLAELARQEILTLEDVATEPVYGFSSRSLLGAVYQRIPQTERRALHDRAAREILDRPRERGRAEERVEHLLKGSDDARAVDAAIEAGDRAAQVFADRRAIEYYARAYARLKGSADRRAAGIALRLGRLFERTGEMERASVWFQAAVTAAGQDDHQTLVEATLGIGAVALVRGLPVETDHHAQKALDLMRAAPDPRLIAVARRLQALVAMQGGDTGRAESLLKSALEDLERAGAEGEAVAVLMDLARMAKKKSELIQGVRYARLAQRRARACGDLPALAEASTVLGRGLLQAAQFGAAKSALIYGLKVARANGDRLRQGLVLREVGNMRIREGDLAGALEHYERSLELMRAVRARADESACLHNIGVARTQLGDFRAAVAALEAALALTRSIGDVQGVAATQVELAQTWAKLGGFDEARRLLQAALETAEIIEDPVTRAEAASLKAWVEVRMGDAGACRQMLGGVDDVIRPLEDPADRAFVLQYAARCALFLGMAPQATALAEHLAVAVDDGALGDLKPVVELLRGQAVELAGDRERAREVLAAAADLAARGQLKTVEVEARGALGRLSAHSDQGVEQLTRAMELMRELVANLTPEMADDYLATNEAHELHAAFVAERDRLRAELSEAAFT
jgi:tetratricopeptide (TPR) repeat protein